MRKNAVKRCLILSILSIGLTLSVFAREMPRFSLKNLDGSTYKSEVDKGNSVILLEFWGACCKARVSELKYLQELQEKYDDKNLKIYAINIDNARAGSRIKPVVKRYKFTFPVLLDPDQEVLRKFSPQKVKPYTVLIDSKGQIIKEIQGENPGKESIIRKMIAEILVSE